MHVARCGSTTHLKVTHRDCPLNRTRGGPGNLCSHVAAPENPSSREDATLQQQVTQETQVDAEADEDSDEDSDDVPLSEKFPGAQKPFPYALGTWVAVEFDAGLFAGRVTKLYPGEDSCMVEFTDGDKEDYDAEQIQYAKELYDREFGPEE